MSVLARLTVGSGQIYERLLDVKMCRSPENRDRRLLNDSEHNPLVFHFQDGGKKLSAYWTGRELDRTKSAAAEILEALPPFEMEEKIKDL